jgi:glutamate synthase domain-containing protein 3
VLENWTAMLPKFVKVFPHEFKRVMAKRVAAAAIQVIPNAETRAALHG